MPNPAETLRAEIFRNDDEETFAILDGASVPGLRKKLFELEPEQFCLFRGELAPDLAEVAPYLVRLVDPSPFADWVLQVGWGQHWGIFGRSPAPLRELRQHFRRFLVVHDAEGNPMGFRYYDPRVLRVYLPTCQPDEVVAIFGPVSEYVVEDEEPKTALRFRNAGGSLETQSIPLAAGSEAAGSGAP